MEEGSARILILESDAEHASLLERYVSMMGFDARVAGDGVSGMKLVSEWSPDLVLTELELPELSGMMVLKELKSNPSTSEIPVVVMSSQKEEEVMIVTLSSGASDFLAKPILMAELTPKLQHALEIKRYRAELKLVNERLEREKQGLSRFFSEDIASRIISGEIGANLGGDSLEATMLFVDIRGSTSIAEKIPAADFAAFLNQALGGFIQAIFENKGSVNKILGDGLLATFGCPAATDDDAGNALRAAQAIRASLAAFNAARPAYLPDPIQIGVGIASGKVFAGNIGTEGRLEYTVLGDPVNLAARLQTLCKRLSADVLLDGATRDRAGNGFAMGAPVSGHVRGKSIEVEIFPLQ
ncbi:MAG: response regulator [Leptospirales bacterium]|nr:response regulator [Leptospirales bacterium]